MSDIKAAAEEIKAVLKKYDLAAMVTLQSPHKMEFVREIAPSWSCAFFEETPEGCGIRVRAKSTDFPSKEQQKECVEQTIGMFFGFEKQASDDRELMENLIRMLVRTFPEIASFMAREK